MMETCAGNGNAADDDDGNDDDFRDGGKSGDVGRADEKGEVQVGKRRAAEEMNSKRGYPRYSARIYSRGLSI